MPVADLLPHRLPMVLLEAVVEHATDRTVCVTTIGENALFREPGGLVPAWVGLEHMAQCIAAHAGLRARAVGEPPSVGFLIGSRRVAFHVAGFTPGQALTVTAKHLWGETGFASFACSVHDSHTGAILAEGTLSVFVPADPGSLAARTAE
jgi:predicted hotdog family 3-hydroxylacyl-ACP dehydratase